MERQSWSKCSRRASPWCSEWAAELKQPFTAHVEAKQAQNVLDYNDLLRWWQQMCAKPALAEHIGSRFDHILVHEYHTRTGCSKPTGKSPQFRVLSGGLEIGAACEKHFEQTGRDYLSVKIDDPSLLAPIRATLVEAFRKGVFHLT